MYLIALGDKSLENKGENTVLEVGQYKISRLKKTEIKIISKYTENNRFMVQS